jgi:CheY-like chemotaxis protein
MTTPSGGPAGLPTILIVDDTLIVRTMLRRWLETAGYQVDDAADGYEALSRLTHGAPVDVIVTDLRMPRMGGRELAAEVKALHLDTPMLFISGYDAHISGADIPGPVLAKPFMAEQLVARVRQLLPRPQPRTA